MAKGLSEIQKKILKVISEIKGGADYYVYDKVKSALYPDLYFMRYELLSEISEPRSASQRSIARMMGVSHSTISRDQSKHKEGEINLKSTSRCVRYYGNGNLKNAARVTVSRAISRLIKRQYLCRENNCIVITDKGKRALLVNDVINEPPLTVKEMNEHPDNEQLSNKLMVNDVQHCAPLTNKDRI